MLDVEGNTKRPVTVVYLPLANGSARLPVPVWSLCQIDIVQSAYGHWLEVPARCFVWVGQVRLRSSNLPTYLIALPPSTISLRIWSSRAPTPSFISPQRRSTSPLRQPSGHFSTHQYEIFSAGRPRRHSSYSRRASGKQDRLCRAQLPFCPRGLGKIEQASTCMIAGDIIRHPPILTKERTIISIYASGSSRVLLTSLRGSCTKSATPTMLAMGSTCPAVMSTPSLLLRIFL
jgi:hypothetical protein